MKLCEGQPATLVFRRDPERVVVSVLGKSAELSHDNLDSTATLSHTSPLIGHVLTDTFIFLF